MISEEEPEVSENNISNFIYKISKESAAMMFMPDFKDHLSNEERVRRNRGVEKIRRKPY